MKSALVTVTLAATLVLSGCGSSHRSSLRRTRTLVPVTTAHFAPFDLSFRYPASWARLDCRGVTTISSSVAYLTNVRPSPSCNGTHAGWPKALAGNDIFVSWTEISMPGRTVGDAPGSHARIDGQPARIERRARPARAVGLACPRIGAQRLVIATIREPLNEGGQLFSVVACLRGPNFEPGEAALQGMLDSVRFTA